MNANIEDTISNDDTSIDWLRRANRCESTASDDSYEIDPTDYEDEYCISYYIEDGLLELIHDEDEDKTHGEDDCRCCDEGDVGLSLTPLGLALAKQSAVHKHRCAKWLFEQTEIYGSSMEVFRECDYWIGLMLITGGNSGYFLTKNYSGERAIYYYNGYNFRELKSPLKFKNYGCDYVWE